MQVFLKSFLFGCTAFALIGAFCLSTVQQARADVSPQFRQKLERQYQSGNIPRPQKDMSMDEKMAIRKKQQQLYEDQQRKQAQAQAEAQARAAQQARQDEFKEKKVRDGWNDSRSRGYYDSGRRGYDSDPRQDRYDRTYEYCQRMWGRGSDFRHCMEDNGMIRRDRYRDDDDRRRFFPW